MSTNINISVGDNKLLDQARLQQNASRQAQLEKEANKRLKSEAEINRVNALAAQGKDANGNPLSGTRFQVPELERRPAANRFGAEEAITMSWISIIPNDVTALISTSGDGQITRALSDTYLGTNRGISIYLSSTDGTYWHSDTGSADLKAPAGFTPGENTSRVPGNETYRRDTILNTQDFDIFPVGKGAFVVSFRFTLAYQKACWTFSEDFSVFPPAPVYTVTLDQATPVTKVYRSYLVSKSNVKELDTPQGIKDYFEGKFPGVIQTSRTLRRYSGLGTRLEARTTPDPAYTLLNDWGSITSFDTVQSSYNDSFRGNSQYQWLNGWWQKAMPTVSGSGTVLHGAPAAYSRASNDATDWPNYFNSVDSVGVVTNNFSSYNTWFAASYAQDQAKIQKPLAYYIASYADLYVNPMTLQLPVYQALYAMPTGYGWYQGITPRVPPSDVSYWKLSKTLSFAPGSTIPVGAGSLPILCVATDWGAPSYCRQEALALGFTSADLTP